MSRCGRFATLFVAAVVASGFGLNSTGGAQEAEGEQLTIQELREDIGLLGLINRLSLDQTQLEDLLALATDLESRRKEMQRIESSPEALAALVKIRQALIEGKQGEEVEALNAPLARTWERLERMEQELGDAMRGAVEQALAMLDDARIDAIIHGEMGPPNARLLGAVNEARHIPPAEFDAWLAEVSRDIALHLAMGNKEAAGLAQTHIQDLLKRVREMSNADFEAQSEALEQEVTNIAQAAQAEPDPQWRDQRARQALTELLMHPRLSAVLKDKLQFMKASA